MTTKTVLLLVISLGIAALVLSAEGFPSANVTTTIEPLPKEDCDKFVKDINDQKRAMVKKLNIADGYELTWDQELANELSEVLRNGRIHLNENRTFFIGMDSLDNLFEEYGIQLEEDEDGSGSYHNIDSLLSPIHKTIGCVGLRSNNFQTVFLADPDGNLRYFQGFYGVPGSNCATGYANNDGLCALIPPTTTTEKTLTQPPAKPTSEAKDKDSVGVTDVTSGSSTTSILIGFLVFSVSFSFSY
ncbi:hypothetical protein GCK72_021539 [Caenorhabditis remanei]|uniref:Uncharacterized protein n=1 Tax=Caenorhabditis remanei TaxID=31234 RepID=A0A6A5GJX7_CAERE|nr:hypothetical protein GCK72_021539 [Caenorhabditis remanei]KAF1754973.1 hypothetical protein GCK72_021539 [Caenorhabditis remanei]